MAATSTKPLSIFLSAQLLYDRQRLEARLHGYFCQSPVPGSEGYHLFRLRLDCQARSQMDGVIGSESVIFCERPSLSNERATNDDQEELGPITMKIAQGPPVLC